VQKETRVYSDEPSRALGSNGFSTTIPLSMFYES